MQRSLILFLHVSSAMGIVAAFGIEGLILLQLPRADARTVLTNYRYAQRLGAASLIIAILTGAYLATVYWGWRGAWMGVGFLTVIAIAAVGAILTGVPVTRAMRTAGDGARNGADLGLSGKLAMSFAIRTALFCGLVFVMTVKPQSGLPALLPVFLAAAIGIVIGLPARRRRSPAPNERNAMAR